MAMVYKGYILSYSRISDMVIFFTVFVFSLFLYSLCPVFLFFSSFTQPTFFMVPLCKPGPGQGFFQLKGSFFLTLGLPGALVSWSLPVLFNFVQHIQSFWSL